MSASLVGSEMCIRDRTCSSAELSLARHSDALGFRLAAACNALSARSMTGCLLYTSDAADDM
eukprot:3295963-Alexandrium_andersonii.AAC.1